MVHLANPAWLWGLLGILVPVGIHFLSRKEGKVYPMGTTRFLTETSTSRFRSIQLNEVGLLVLRCLLISVLVLFLAGLTIHSQDKSKWLLIEPGLENREEVRMLRDTLVKSGYKTRYFADGFPWKIDSSQRHDYWGLIHELTKLPVGEMVIVSRQTIANFRGERLSLPDHFRWIGISQSDTNFVTPQGLRGSTNRMSTSFDNDSQPPKIPFADTVRVDLIYDPKFSYEKDLLVAALESMQAVTGQRFALRINPPDPDLDGHWRFFLGVLPPAGATRAIYWNGSAEFPSLLQRDGTDQKTYTMGRLTPDGILRAKFIANLSRVLLAERDTIYGEYPDVREMPDKMLWASSPTVVDDGNINTEEAAPWILLIFTALLVFERYASRLRNQ